MNEPQDTIDLIIRKKHTTENVTCPGIGIFILCDCGWQGFADRGIVDTWIDQHLDAERAKLLSLM